jgi:predicted nucleotidyltransferase component of viral defense system
MDKEESVKLEISIRQPPLDKPVHNGIKHFYQDPFTGEDLFPGGKILSLSLNEAVAEKLKAAITRRDVAVRDYYDLWYIAESGFDFYSGHFIKLFKAKLAAESYTGDFRKNFGLNPAQIALLRSQINLHLAPVIRADENFDPDKVFERFNVILQKI